MSKKKEKKVYFTITGMFAYYGSDIIEKGSTVLLEKEPENQYDREAIKVSIKGAGKIGYVANSVKTVLGDSISAGRLYDKIGNKAKGKVVAIVGGSAICVIKD